VSRCLLDSLAHAIAENHDPIEEILEIYTPLIDYHSKIGGRIDKDCRQYILMHIAINIFNFTI